ncbi:MAG: endonuclease/exonuclease/phosphatase family protein [Planctomycetota bacterium]
MASPNAPLRVATFNASLSRDLPGALATELAGESESAAKVAAIIQETRPDILVLLEFDRDPSGTAIDLFRRRFLAVGQHGKKPIDYPYRFVPRVNTGVPSGIDFDGDGRVDGPGDAFGFGRHPGHYGFAILSRFPIEEPGVRSFQRLLWKEMPDNSIPPEFFSAEALAALRLSSKTHVDVPIRLTDQRTIHILACHPTPPVFDGPEDRNGRRNHDEIRFWADYVAPERAEWIVDDGGTRGGLVPGAPFVICGDLNCDPNDGDSAGQPVQLLLTHPRIHGEFQPRSDGGVEASRRDAGKNATHKTLAQYDTGDFDDERGPGNLRLDYVLPSRDLQVADGGVFWPLSSSPDASLVTVSDHRLVWLDLR